MPNKYRMPLRWVLYALWMLVAFLVQTLHVPWRAPICAVPAAVACVCLFEGAEKGGLFALVSAVAWCLTGGTALSIVTLTFCGILVGLLGERLLEHSLAVALLVSFGTLAVTQGAAFCYEVFFGTLAPRAFFPVLLLQVGLGLAASVPLYGLCRFSRKVGGL